MINWQDNPRYQRALQKLQRMSPDQRAIVDTAMLDESFGDAETRKMITSLQRGSEKKYRTKRLELSGRAQTASHDIQKQELDLSRQGLAERTRSSTAMQNLRRKSFEYDKSQLPISTALGVANVGLSGYTGYQDMKRKQSMADIYRTMARNYR